MMKRLTSWIKGGKAFDFKRKNKLSEAKEKFLEELSVCSYDKKKKILDDEMKERKKHEEDVIDMLNVIDIKLKNGETLTKKESLIIK